MYYLSINIDLEKTIHDDFSLGKSYFRFILYPYLTVVAHPVI